MKLSIIIPAYNVEKYIESCISSCCEQKPFALAKDYEIVVVNDGSKDATSQILEKLKHQIPELQIITQKNQGLSAARNAGLEIAQGEYVWFVDGDDYILKNGICRLPLDSRDIDGIQIFSTRVVDENTEPEIFFPKFSGHLSGQELFLRNKFSFCAPYTIYRRAFLIENGLRFLKGIFHEDMEFTPRAYFFAEKIKQHSEPIYFHRLNPNSITQIVNPQRGFDSFLIAQSLILFSQTVVKDSKFTIQLANVVGGVVVAGVALMSRVDNGQEVRRFCRDLKANRFVFDFICRGGRLKYQFYGRMLKWGSCVSTISYFFLRVVFFLKQKMSS